MIISTFYATLSLVIFTWDINSNKGSLFQCPAKTGVQAKLQQVLVEAAVFLLIQKQGSRRKTCSVQQRRSGELKDLENRSITWSLRTQSVFSKQKATADALGRCLHPGLLYYLGYNPCLSKREDKAQTKNQPDQGSHPSTPTLQECNTGKLFSFCKSLSILVYSHRMCVI